MLTFILILVSFYISNKFTRLYCVFKYKNDAKFITNILKNEEFLLNLKKGIEDVNLIPKMREGVEND